MRPTKKRTAKKSPARAPKKRKAPTLTRCLERTPNGEQCPAPPCPGHTRCAQHRREKNEALRAQYHTHTLAGVRITRSGAIIR